MFWLVPNLGLSFDRPKKPRRERCEPDPEEKKKYLEEANQFAMSLVEGLGDPDGNIEPSNSQDLIVNSPL